MIFVKSSKCNRYGLYEKKIGGMHDMGNNGDMKC